jgi:hypothetical protein
MRKLNRATVIAEALDLLDEVGLAVSSCSSAASPSLRSCRWW